jgi:hypothetical protein
MTKAERVRRVLSAVLVVVGSIGLVVASTGWWLERSLLDTGNFTERADAILDQPEVQAELTHVLVRQLSERTGTDLEIAQPFLSGIVARVVDSNVFRAVFDRALSTAHGVIVDRDTERIVLRLTGAYELVRGPLDQVAPRLAAELPSRKRLDILLLHRSQLTTVWDAIDQVKRAVDVVTVGAVIFVLAGIALAVDRWRALALGGFVVVGSVVVLLVLLLVGRFVLTAQTDDPTLADALRVAYRVLVESLVVQSVLVGVVALAVALGARAVARRPIGAWRRAPRDAWTWMTGLVPGATGGVEAVEAVGRLRLPSPRDDTRGVRVLRMLALVALGLFAVLEPDTLTDAVAIAFGIVVLYLGALEGVAAWRAPRSPRASLPRNPTPSLDHKQT